MKQHRFSRMELLVGTPGLTRLATSSVAVFGLGGVGSYAVEALARAGVGRLTLIDFDAICLTNVNRQLHALDGTVGRPKAAVMAERCRLINPAISVEPLQEFYSEKNSPELLNRGYDYVLDCIDHVTAKLHLLQSCMAAGIPVISSMGAANKIDPTCIKVDDLFKTSSCGLARILRKELRKRGVSSGIRAVYSTEEYLPPEQKNATCAEDCICPQRDDDLWNCRHRRIILGSSSYIPPLFGLTMAGEVIRTLLKDVD